MSGDSAEPSDTVRHLRKSRRCYYWLFIWLLLMLVFGASAANHGWAFGAGEGMFWASLLAGYMLFVDLSHSVWWTNEQIWWRGWNHLSLRPLRHSVRIIDITKIVFANHFANRTRNRPFDRILLVSPSDTITIMPSFHRREELEELLHHIEMARSDIFIAADVRAFMAGEFSEWWRYR